MLNKLIFYALYFFCRILLFTCRFRYFGTEHFRVAQKFHSKSSFCLASWHEHTMAGILGQAGLPYCLLVSRSKDGDLVDFISKRLGYKSARGSSSRGGKEARLLLEEYISDGFSAAFTIDGPRGPRGVCKAGILKTALNTHTAILPVCALPEKAWILHKSWDQSQIPKPFSRIVYQFGPPLVFTEPLTEEEFTHALHTIEERMRETQLMAQHNLDCCKEGEGNLGIFSKDSEGNLRS